MKRNEHKKLVEDLKNKNWADSTKKEEPKKVDDVKGITLEKIQDSDVAVFQTVEFGPSLGEAELMKSEVSRSLGKFDDLGNLNEGCCALSF